MIQRKQSVYLLLVLLFSAALFYVPLFTDSSSGISTGIKSNTALILMNVAVGTIALISIFLFKNRNLQVRLSNLNILIICILVGSVFYFSGQPTIHYEYGCYFPLAQLILTVLAIRSIKKDEELVRSADRLR